MYAKIDEYQIASVMHFGFVEKGYPGPNGGGGAGTFVQIVGRHLVEQGHKVTVVARVRGGVTAEEDDRGVRVFRVPVSESRFLRLLRFPGFRGFRHSTRYLSEGRAVSIFLDDLHRRDAFDLVEFSEGGDYWHRRNSPFKVVSHLHGSRYTFLRNSDREVDVADWRQRKLELRFIHAADWVLSPSRALARHVEDESGRSLPRLTVRPYPLDVVSAVSADRRVDRSSPLKVIFAARNDPVKGGDVLLEAARTVNSVSGQITFDFFGYVPTEGQEMPEVVRIHGFVRREELLGHYRQADVAVIPSFWDNSPNTVYEAMAAGLPVIASAVGGIPELVVDGESGFLVEPGNWREIADRLQRLSADPDLRIRMGVSARQRIMELANPGPNLKARTELYLTIVSGRPDPVRPLAR